MTQQLQFILGLIFCLIIVPIHAADEQSSDKNPLSEVKPAIVNLSIHGKLPYPKAKRQRGKQSDNKKPKKDMKRHGLGSGVIINADKGYILTNAHIIENAKVITVTLSNGRRLEGKKIGIDKASDIAVIQVDSSHLKQVKLADSDQLQVGDAVYAIGNPYGLSHTVTSGVISALHRSNVPLNPYEDFIQTDAPINPGNSGGALVNQQGEVIGINTAMLGPNKANVGIGFAIPVNMAQSIAQQLIKHGEIKRGFLGLTTQNLTPELADNLNLPGIKGALVTSVIPNSPADKAGIHTKDVVLGLNGKTIESATDLHNKVGLKRPGSQIDLKIARPNTNVFDAKVKLIDQAKLKVPATIHPLLQGIQLHDFNQIIPGIGQIQGVQAINVDEDSQAWFDGLRPGDIILSINDHRVHNLKQLQNLVNPDDDHLLVKIQRKKMVIYIVIGDEEN